MNARGGRGGPLNILRGPQKMLPDRIKFENVHMLPLNPTSNDYVGLYMFMHYLCMLFLIKPFLMCW